VHYLFTFKIEVLKRIYIVRHAKSSWDDMRLADVDRPLNKRGKRDAPVMAEVCLDRRYIPELMITSHANRAASTAKEFCKVFGVKEKTLVYEKSLYHAPEDTYISTCFGFKDKVNSVMMFGHNPGITYLANSVTKNYIDNVPTCGVLVIEAKIDSWVDLDFSKCKLKDFLYPKMF
jgi:phosphohistidine phosphatase